MTKPAVVPTWATDATFTTSPASGENGNATKVDPGAPYKAQGFVPGTPFVGAYLNWLAGKLCDWAAYLNALNTDSSFVGANFAWTGSHTIPSANLTYSSAEAGKAVADLLTGSPNTDSDLFTTTAGLVGLYTPGGTWRAGIRLPHGATITSMDAGWVQGAGHTTIASSVALIRLQPDWGSPYGTAQTTVLSAVSTGAGTKYMSPSSPTVGTAVVDNTLYKYFIELTASDSVGVGAPDTFRAVRVSFTVPRPVAW